MGYEAQVPGQAPNYLEVIHRCGKSKNMGSTLHGPFPLFVFLGIKPWVQKLEGEEDKGRGLLSCIPEDRQVLLNLTAAKYQGKTSDSRASFAKRQAMWVWHQRPSLPSPKFPFIQVLEISIPIPSFRLKQWPSKCIDPVHFRGSTCPMVPLTTSSHSSVEAN